MEDSVKMWNRNNYFEELIGKVYKLLPIYEGKPSRESVKEISPESACINYQKELLILTTKIMGDYELYKDPVLLDVVTFLKGMKQFNVGEHTEVKTCVFSLIKKIKSQIQ